MNDNVENTYTCVENFLVHDSVSYMQFSDVIVLKTAFQ